MTLGALRLEGTTYSRVTVMSRAGLNLAERGFWNCTCACGAELKLHYTSVTKKKIKSCGCTHSLDLREYIEENSVPIPFAGCWLWLGAFWNHGYGEAYFPGEKTRLAHRLSFIGFNGQIPDDKLAQHSCDRQWCVCPGHLSEGTDKTNSDDMWSKGRGNCKLSDDQVREIREAGTHEAHHVVCARFGISSSLVSMIVNRKRWERVI